MQHLLFLYFLKNQICQSKSIDISFQKKKKIVLALTHKRPGDGEDVVLGLDEKPIDFSLDHCFSLPDWDILKQITKEGYGKRPNVGDTVRGKMFVKDVILTKKFSSLVGIQKRPTSI